MQNYYERQTLSLTWHGKRKILCLRKFELTSEVVDFFPSPPFRQNVTVEYASYMTYNNYQVHLLNESLTNPSIWTYCTGTLVDFLDAIADVLDKIS